MRSSRSRPARSASTTRRCATASRRSASCSRPRTSSSSRALSTTAGVDRIEAGFPRVSDDDAEAIKLIAAAGLRAEIWGFSRAVPADVEALVELGVRAAVIESPISDLKLEALGVSRETMLERIAKAVSFAVGHGITVAFFGVDSTRARSRLLSPRLLGSGRGGRAARSSPSTRSASRPRRPRRTSSAAPSSGSTFRSTGTATTTSGSRPPPPSPPSRPARPGCTAP